MPREKRIKPAFDHTRPQLFEDIHGADAYVFVPNFVGVKHRYGNLYPAHNLGPADSLQHPGRAAD
jgi:hypothetical protein